jgi:hypothetical protein
MRPAAERASVTAQAVEIARTTLRQELRRTRGSTASRGRLTGLVATVFLYVFAGFLMGISMARGVDPFTIGVFSTSAFMLLAAIFVVMEFATIVTGPDDLAFYLPLPVPARAYVAAKISVTCLFVLAFAVAYALPAAIILPAMGMPLGLLFAHLYALADGALISALSVIAVLGLAVRVVSYKRVREVASWVQFVIFIGVYGGFSIFQRSLGAMAGSFRLNLSPLLLLAPSAWAPSLLRLEEGLLPGIGLAASVAAPVLLFVAAVRVVGRSYDSRATEAAIAAPATARTGRTAGSGAFWRSPEERGLALLIGNLFRHDSQFRMGVLMIIPVTALYVLIILFVNKAPILDPFSPAGQATFGATILLYLAVGFYPSYVKSALTYTSNAEASWIFYASPADPLLIVRGARRFILVFFIAPYLVLLGAAYAVFTGQIVHTLQHFLLIGLLVVIETDVLLLFSPQLPFSRKAGAGRRGGASLLRIFAGVLILVPIYLLVLLVYPHPLAYWPALGAVAACLAIVRVTGRRYAARRLAREELVP